MFIFILKIRSKNSFERIRSQKLIVAIFYKWVFLSQRFPWSLSSYLIASNPDIFSQRSKERKKNIENTKMINEKEIYIEFVSNIFCQRIVLWSLFVILWVSTTVFIFPIDLSKFIILIYQSYSDSDHFLDIP